jgi:hypothetical protein
MLVPTSKRSMKAYAKVKRCSREEEGERRDMKTFKLKESFVKVGRGPRRWY